MRPTRTLGTNTAKALSDVPQSFRHLQALFQTIELAHATGEDATVDIASLAAIGLRIARAEVSVPAIGLISRKRIKARRADRKDIVFTLQGSVRRDSKHRDCPHPLPIALTAQALGASAVRQQK